MGVQIAIVLVLLLLMQVVTGLGAQVDSETIIGSRTLVSVGFVLLAAFASGELFRRFRLPALLGYLVAGVLFGPHFANLVLGSPELAPLSDSVIHDIGLVNVLAVGVIGTTSGAEIQVAHLREQFGRIAAISASIFCLTVPTVTATVMVVASVYPAAVPFVQGVPETEKWIVALLFGVLAAGMSPAATLALLQELRARGPFTSMVLGIVVFADVLLVASFLLTLAAAKLAVGSDGLSLEGLKLAVPHIGAEFGWALLLGVVAGLALIAYLHFVKREALLFALGVLFVTSFAAERLHAETLLAFLLAGFVVQNCSRYGHDLVHIFERMALPVFMVYFMTQTARLDLAALGAFLPLTLVLVVIRLLTFYIGITGSLRVWPAGAEHRQHLWKSFFSQGGVDLVLAGAVATAIPTWGDDLRTVVTATVIIYIMLGPPFLAHALDAVGESASARERGVEDLGTRASTAQGAGAADFKMPTFADGVLQTRLFTLREQIVALRQQRLDTELMDRCNTRSAKLLNVSRTVTAIFDRSVNVAETHAGQPEQRAQKLALLAAELDGAIVTSSRGWTTRTEFNPIRPDDLTQLFASIEQMEAFQSSYRVAREPELFTIRGGRYARLVRRLRGLRRAIVGVGSRTVPLGRLWRYYVTLEVPARIWSGLQPGEAELWANLSEHFRVTRSDLRDAIAGELTPRVTIGTASYPTVGEGTAATGEGETSGKRSADQASASGDSASHKTTTGSAKTLDSKSNGEAGGGDFAEDDEDVEVPQPSLDERLLSALKAAAADARVRERKIQERMRALDDRIRTTMVSALTGTWADLLSAAELAGTFERPAWTFRPSRRFDAAQAAKAELVERLVRDMDQSAGYRDAVISLAHAQRFVGRTMDFVSRVAERIRGAMESAAKPFVELVERRGTVGVEPTTDLAGEEGPDLVGELEALRAQAPAEELLSDDSMVQPRARAATVTTAMVTDEGREAASNEVEALRTELEQLVAVVDHLATAISREELVGIRAVAPERALLEVPEELSPLGLAGRSAAAERAERRAPIRLRAWLQRSFLQEATVARVAAEEELELGLARTMARLHHARQVADYYAADLQNGGQVDKGFVGRVIAMVDAGRGDLEQSSVQAREKLLAKVRDQAEVAVDPLRNGRWEDVRKRLRRAGDADRVASQRAAIGDSLRGRARVLSDRIAPLIATLREELAALFAEQTPPAAEEAFRELVYRTRAEHPLPPTYERLFTSVPAESVGLIVDRPEFRAAKQALDSWRAGGPGGMLIWGMRGAGKRTCVRWLAAGGGDDLEVSWIRLSPGLEREADVSKQVAQIMGVRPVRDFAVLAALVRGASAATRRDDDSEKRQKVIVIENAERLFRRNPEGLARMRKFLDLISSNSRDVMWIVLMTEASVRLLDPVLELRARFPTSLHFGMCPSNVIEAMITARHRLSALSLEVVGRRPRLGEFVRNPRAALRSLYGPDFGVYERIAYLSGGNPRQALRLWLASTRVEGGEAGRAIVGPITAMPCSVLGDLPLSGQVLLAALTLHGPLRRQELMGMQAPGSLDIDAEVARLEHLDLIVVERTSDRRDLGGNPLVRIDARVMQPLTAELRASNLL